MSNEDFISLKNSENIFVELKIKKNVNEILINGNSREQIISMKGKSKSNSKI